MRYRAKITSILDWVKSQYNTNKFHIVRDEKDFYIEVSDEHEAELLEQINQDVTNDNY